MHKPSSDSRVQHFGKLVIADLSFKQVLALCSYMMDQNIKADDPIFPPQMCGVVVTYARNFVSGTSFGELPDRFRRFESEELRETHKRLIEARNQIYAHRDAESVKTMEFESPRELVPYQVTVAWTPNFVAYPVTPELPPDILPFVANLVKFQSDRVSAHLKKIGNGMLIKGKKYEPHRRYTVGVDFP